MIENYFKWLFFWNPFLDEESLRTLIENYILSMAASYAVQNPNDLSALSDLTQMLDSMDFV